MMAAGALYALDHHRGRLSEDHRRARSLAEGLSTVRGVEIDVAGVETNIVRFRLVDMSARDFARRCEARGVLLNYYAAGRLRAVPHLQTTDADVERAIEAFREAVE